MTVTNIDRTAPVSSLYSTTDDARGVDRQVKAGGLDTVSTGEDDWLSRVFGQPGRGALGAGAPGFRAGAYQVQRFGAASTGGPATRATLKGLNLPTINRPPSPAGIGYYTGVGSGAALKNWLNDVFGALRGGNVKKTADAARTTNGVLQDTIVDESKKVDKALAKDMKSGAIKRLNAKSGGRVTVLLNQYAKDNQAVQDASQDVAIARSKYASAGHKLDAATNRMSARDQANAKSDLVAERKKIQARIAKRGANFKAAISIATDFVKNPVAAAKKHGWDKAQKAALDIMSESDLARVVELDAKIAVIDKRIKGNLDAATRSDLQAARADLVAAKHGLIKANLRLAGARDNRWRTVDELASLEVTYPKAGSTTFRAMQSFYKSVSHLGKTAHDHSQNYVNALHAPPFGDDNKHSTQLSATDAYALARSDVKTYTQRWDASKYNWISSRARNIAGYAAGVDRFARTEIAEQEAFQARIEGGKHLDYTTKIFTKIGVDVFGNTLHKPHNRYNP